MRKSLASSDNPSSHSFVFPWTFRPKGFAFVVALDLAFGGLGAGDSNAAELSFGTIATSTGDANASGSHTLVIGPDGFVYASGRNNYGRLGIGSSEYEVSSPRAVDRSGVLFDKTIVAVSVSVSVSVSVGSEHSLALDSDGKVYGWGMNSNGELGTGSGDYSSSVPVAMIT